MGTAAFDRFVMEHQGSVFRLCRSIVRDEHLGADAAQETFLRLWRQLCRGRLPERPAAWIHRTAVTASIDLVRRRRVRLDGTRRIVEKADLDDVQDLSPPEANLSYGELRQGLDLALEKLSEGQRTVFLLRHDGGLSLAEVAQALGVSLPTVKTQFARAILKLQELLGPYRPGKETRP